MPEFTQLSTLYIAWIKQESDDIFSEDEAGSFPLFITGSREKVLCTLKLPNEGDMSKRIIAGAALLLTDQD